MESRKKMARAAILAATVTGVALMFTTPFEAQAYSGSRDGYCGQCTHYPPPVVKIVCSSGQQICIQTGCTNGYC